MRTRTPLTVLTAATALMLTGCGDPIDGLGEDATRADRDEAYAAYMAEVHPEADHPGWVDFNLRLCSVLGTGKVYPGELDELFVERGVTAEKIPVVQDIVYQGVRVYCPENLPQVEYMRPATT